MIVQTAYQNFPEQVRWWTVAIQTRPGKHWEQQMTSVLCVTAPEDNSFWQRQVDPAIPSAQAIHGATIHTQEGLQQLAKFGNRYFLKLWAFCFWAEQVFLAVKKMDSVHEESTTDLPERGEWKGIPLAGKADEQYGPAGSRLMPKLQVAQLLPSPETIISYSAGKGLTIWPKYVGISGQRRKAGAEVCFQTLFQSNNLVAVTQAGKLKQISHWRKITLKQTILQGLTSTF